LTYTVRCWIVSRLDRTPGHHRWYFSGKNLRNGAWGWGTYPSHAKEYRTQKSAESAAMKVVMRNPEWISEVEVTRRTRALETR